MRSRRAVICQAREALDHYRQALKLAPAWAALRAQVPGSGR
jgi:hypothetical protein